jgi:hypothetical protein
VNQRWYWTTHLQRREATGEVDELCIFIANKQAYTYISFPKHLGPFSSKSKYSKAGMRETMVAQRQ